MDTREKNGRENARRCYLIRKMFPIFHDVIIKRFYYKSSIKYKTIALQRLKISLDIFSKMNLEERHLYHPFTHSSLGFSYAQDLPHKNHTSLILDDIDLYYQPLEHPAFAITQLLLRLIYTILGEFVQFKLFNMVKKEKFLVNEVTQVYCISSMVAYPFWLLYSSATDFIHPLKEIFGNWFCVMGRIVIYLHMNVAMFHSFITALMRYLFIVHEKKVRAYGKTKTKKMFLALTVFLPIVLVTWGLVENQELAMYLFLNRCYGIDHKVFLAEVTTGKNLFCKMTSFGTNDHDPFTTKLRQYTCIIKFILSLVIGLNIPEGLIYILIFSYIKRYDILTSAEKNVFTVNSGYKINHRYFREHNKSMEKLRKLLTKSSKIRRNRRLLLNIQMQFLAWFLEVLLAVIAILIIFSPFSLASTFANHFSAIGYFVIVPGMYLVNCCELKTIVVQNQWYIKFTNVFFPNAINAIIPDNEPLPEVPSNPDAIVEVIPNASNHSEENNSAEVA